MKGDNPVVVVGGGLAGLSCGVALSDAGIPVHLFERANCFGGRARSFADEVTGETVDIGPHVLTNDHRNTLALLRRLGTVDEISWQPERFVTLVDGRNVVSMRNYRLPAPLHFLPNFFRIDRLSIADIWSARRVLWRVMQMNECDVLEWDDEVAEDALRKLGVSEQFIDWFWRTVCMAIMNVPLEQCSAGSLFRFLKMMSGRSDFHFGFPKVGLADLYVPGALAVIRSVGGNAQCNCAVTGIEFRHDAITGVVLGDGKRVDTAQCVLATPPDDLERLLPASLQQAARFQANAFRPTPYISTYMWFSRKLTRERFWARIWSRNNVNYDFYDLSNIRNRERGGSLVAANCIFSKRFNALTDSEIVDATLLELSEFLPDMRRDYLVHARVHRIEMAIVAPYPGFEKRRAGTRTAVNGLFLAGDWTRTSVPESMESAVRSGFLAAEAIAADRGVDLECAEPLLPMRGLAGWIWRRSNKQEI